MFLLKTTTTTKNPSPTEIAYVDMWSWVRTMDTAPLHTVQYEHTTHLLTHYVSHYELRVQYWMYG